jgi:HK97 family phage portal protein
VLPVILPSGRIAYDISDPLGLYGQVGNMHRVFADEVIHLRDRSDNGIIGRSRLSRTAGAVQTALSLQDFHQNLMRNGANPSGVFSTEQKVHPDSRKRLVDALKERIAGTTKAGKFLVLDGGWKWQQISVSPEDAELLASRKFSTEEMARIYGVPPPLVGIWDHSSFHNSETAGRWLAIYTLTPWLAKIEAEFARVVFGANSPSNLSFDLNGLLRGDSQARWATYDIASKDRLLLPDEIRALEGFPPLPDGAGATFPLVGADITRPPPNATLPPENAV